LATPFEDDIVIGSCVLVHFLFLPNICGIFPRNNGLVEMFSHSVLGVMSHVSLFSEVIRKQGIYLCLGLLNIFEELISNI
jgi:hypothetical protein